MRNSKMVEYKGPATNLMRESWKEKKAKENSNFVFSQPLDKIVVSNSKMRFQHFKLIGRSRNGLVF